MAITTDSYIQIDIDGVNYGKVGLSKTLDNYSIDEIAENAYCGEYNELIPLYSFGQPDTPLTAGSAGWPYPLTITRSNQAQGGRANYNYLYGRVVWLEGTGSTVLTEDNFGSIKMVTEMQAPKMVYTVPALDGGFSSIKPASWDGSRAFPSDYQASGIGSMTFHTNYGRTNDKTFSLSIHPYAIYVVDDVHFFVSLRQISECCTFYGAENVSIYGSGNTFNTGGFGNITGETTLGSTVSVSYLTSNSTFSGNNELPFSYNLGQFNTSNKYGWDRQNKYVVQWTSGGNWGGLYAGVFVYHHFGNKMDSLKFFAGCGVIIEADKPYKPIIEGGVVTGISEDLAATSELDEWNGSTAHNVPTDPPRPHESFDSDQTVYNDAYTTGVPSSQLYAMTLAQVNDMFDKLGNGGIIPANFEPGNAVISIQRYPFSLSSFASANTANITWTARPDVIGPETPTRIMFPPTGEEITGYPIYNPVKKISLGSFTLSEFWTNYIAFLNREIAASLYIPFCGIIDIDINAILNKTITVYLTIDVISGGCTAAVDINGCMYTTVSGSCSADMYFSTSNYGTIRAALRSNTAEQVYNVAQLAAGAIGAAATGGLTAGWATQAATGAGFNILGKAIKRTMMRNGVTPSVHGSAGDMSSWKLPMHCQLILSLPRPNRRSDNIYGHSHSFLTVTKKTVGSCSGLTVCDNPDVTNISTATDTEKEMIYNMLQNGVYV